MRKYSIKSAKGKTTIYEVEIEVIRTAEDVSVSWLNPGEYKARVLKPISFHQRIEKLVDGKKEIVMVPDIWCWHAFYESVEDARAQATKWIKEDMVDFAIRKHREPATEEEVQAAIAAVEIITL